MGFKNKIVYMTKNKMNIYEHLLKYSAMNMFGIFNNFKVY